ncbi:type II toxin-antitoxin system HipA family toxin [Chitinimonas arctica]|uniref:Type II toxin-antitoxin system HipA family toxin n=1 Tax=Chitinimonas arctica TaxID=2594795 RepID=A0A516SBJ8_9NEIS|nr:type II toxin-antitoxin system HipA family toxin [Chitinimonas arctica]QDQ25525.1 type II toxin-antitoxin system HipA family toxin [Chitinimonas arctica]
MARETLVHVWPADAVDPIVAGVFRLEPDRRVGTFTYDDQYRAGHFPGLAPDMPIKNKQIKVINGDAIFPLFRDAGPDDWGRRVLERRLGRPVDLFESLVLCPVDGVGNIALGELDSSRSIALTLDEFLEHYEALDTAKKLAETHVETAVLQAVNNGTSLGGTKPKLSIERKDKQFLLKFPANGDTPWLPHVEAALLCMATKCGINACKAEVYRLPGKEKFGLLVERFDRYKVNGGFARIPYVSAHSVLRMDIAELRADPRDIALYATRGFDPQSLARSYPAFADAMMRWCGGKTHHAEQLRELWRRIVFNGLVRNIDDHTRNHGLICSDPHAGIWQLSPAFDVVTPVAAMRRPAMSSAYRYVKAGRHGTGTNTPRLVWSANREDLIEAAVSHYQYEREEASMWFEATQQYVRTHWQTSLLEQGMPNEEVARYENALGLGWE